MDYNFIALFTIVQLINIYILYLFMVLFYGKPLYSRKVNIICFGLAVIIIDLVYFLVKIPAIQLLTAIIYMYSLSHLFKSNFINRVKTTSILFYIFFVIEALVAINAQLYISGLVYRYIEPSAFVMIMYLLFIVLSYLIIKYFYKKPKHREIAMPWLLIITCLYGIHNIVLATMIQN